MGGCFIIVFYLFGETGFRGLCGYSGIYWLVSLKNKRVWGEGNGREGVKES